MSGDGQIDPEELSALIRAIDQLGPEASALLVAARPAIHRALSRGIAKVALRQAIAGRTGIRLSAAQFEKLLHQPDGLDGEEPLGVMAEALVSGREARTHAKPLQPGSGR